jgi:hypothetical protein
MRIFYKGKSTLLHNLFLLALFTICVFQSIMVMNEYALLFSKRIWRNRSLDAYERSANFLLGTTGADFMRFIESNTPIDKPVVVVERSANFASQNILQYFLLPRPIVACDCSNLGGKCNPCLQSPDSYVPVTQNFPPMGAVGPAKIFVPFDSPTGNDSDYYLGLYVPKIVENQPSNLGGSWNTLIIIKTLIIDLSVLICFGLLGYLIIHLINPGIHKIDALSLSIPAGAGILTWFIFLASLAGISITLVNILIIYLLIIVSILIISWRLIKKPFFSIKVTFSFDFLEQFRQFDFFSIVLVLSILAMFAIAIFISIGRGYSNYDDIAIWSLKGYGIAYKSTIFAGYLLGGHGLAYPLSFPLSITIFKLASGDLLPGSKFLFPIYSIALLWGGFSFLRRRGVNSKIALVGTFLLISIPQFFYYTTVGYANIAFTSCLVLGVLWGINGLIAGNKRELLLSSFLFGFAGWIRPEGILFGGILIVVMLAWYLIVKGRRVWRIGYWLLPGLILPISWLIFARNYVKEDQAGGALTALMNQIRNGQPINFEPLIMTARYGMEVFSNPKIWGLILPVILVFILLALPRTIRRNNLTVWPLVLVTLVSFIIPAALFFVESSTESNFSTFLAMSFDRAYLPAIFLSVMTAFVALFSNPSTDLLEADAEVDVNAEVVNQ